MAQRRNPKATSYPKNHQQQQQQQHHHHHPTMDPTSHPPQSFPFSTPTSNSKQHHPIPSSILNKLKSHFPRKPNSTHLPTPDPPPPRLDSRFQPKSLTLSANGADLYTRRTPPHPCHNPTKQIIMDKQRSLKETSTRKVKKEEPDLDFNLKQQQQRLSSISLTNERRKSFGDAKIDLADFFFSLTARVVAVDMPPFMQIHAVSCARKAYDSLEDKHSTKNLACTLKKEFDGVYGPAWHCIVGSSFGSFVTHSVNGFFYFSIDHKMYVLLFKTAVQRAD